MILRKKAISVKEHVDSLGNHPNEAPSVYYVILTSCDKFGRPEFPVSFFDSVTKRSFKKYDIKVLTVHDLVVHFKKDHPNWDGKTDIFPRSSVTDHEKNQQLLKVFDDCFKKYIEDKMKFSFEFIDKMKQNGINSQNAFQEMDRRAPNPNKEMTLLDVYILLFSFIKKHRKDHIFVDELPILHSKYCKFNSNLAHF